MILNMNMQSGSQRYYIDADNVETEAATASPEDVMFFEDTSVDSTPCGIVVSKKESSVSPTAGVVKYLVALASGGVYMVDELNTVVADDQNVFGTGYLANQYVISLSGLKFGTADPAFPQNEEYKYTFIRQ